MFQKIDHPLMAPDSEAEVELGFAWPDTNESLASNNHKTACEKGMLLGDICWGNINDFRCTKHLPGLYRIDETCHIGFKIETVGTRFLKGTYDVLTELAE